MVILFPIIRVRYICSRKYTTIKIFEISFKRKERAYHGGKINSILSLNQIHD